MKNNDSGIRFHLNLHTARYEAMRHFYMEILGGKCTFPGIESECVMELGGAQITLIDEPIAVDPEVIALELKRQEREVPLGTLTAAPVFLGFEPVLRFSAEELEASWRRVLESRVHVIAPLTPHDLIVKGGRVRGAYARISDPDANWLWLDSSAL